MNKYIPKIVNLQILYKLTVGRARELLAEWYRIKEQAHKRDLAKIKHLSALRWRLVNFSKIIPTQRLKISEADSAHHSIGSFDYPLTVDKYE